MKKIAITLLSLIFSSAALANSYNKTVTLMNANDSADNLNVSYQLCTDNWPNEPICSGIKDIVIPSHKYATPSNPHYFQVKGLTSKGQFVHVVYATSVNPSTDNKDAYSNFGSVNECLQYSGPIVLNDHQTPFVVCQDKGDM